MADTPRTANQAIAIVRVLLSFAVQHGLRTSNPAAGIKAYRENKRERFLSEAEIGAAADAITQAESRGIGPFAAAGLRFTCSRCPKWRNHIYQMGSYRLGASVNQTAGFQEQ